MPKAEGSIKIVYEWKYLDSGSKDITNQQHIQALHESAEDQIRQAFSKEGKLCGDLKDNIYMGDGDPSDGVNYVGKWRAEFSPS